MTTPQNYYALSVEYQRLRALAFRVVMSDACKLSAPEVQALFDVVGNMDATEADTAIREWKATQ